MKTPQLGLRANWKQFLLLILINALVGTMLGMERTIFPRFADEVFGVESKLALLSFIVAFGISKAITNYFTGIFANTFGRKKLLILGWLLAFPVPLLLIYAPNWNWVIAANILLGISQGITWGITVIMKVDLVGPKESGIAIGLNEFAGYLALGLTALFSARIADTFGISPYPFYIGIAASILGILLAIFFIKDTEQFVKLESKVSSSKKLPGVFMQTSFKHPSLSAITQAGFANNLNDGMIWGLLPVFLIAQDFTLDKIGLIASIYPMTWGISQLATGKLADHFSKKLLLVLGMLLQGLVLLVIPLFTGFYEQLSFMVFLGIGTALVYPTFMAAITEKTHPQQRAESLGTFRFWRDLGYAFGAISSGIIADIWDVNTAIFAIGAVTVLSSMIVQSRMSDKKNR